MLLIEYDANPHLSMSLEERLSSQATTYLLVDPKDARIESVMIPGGHAHHVSLVFNERHEPYQSVNVDWITKIRTDGKIIYFL